MNKIEVWKREKDGLDVLEDLYRYARGSWTDITEGDLERLKWYGIFYRKHTPGFFMMRVRISNGITHSEQIRALATIAKEHGKAFVDITTRQQIQLRWFTINEVPAIWEALHQVGLNSLQTGMDNIRNVVGCPVAGLTTTELFDASPIIQDFVKEFLGNREYTNLPRKFNVTITGCRENCCHAETQDLALVPATKEVNGETLLGFNLLVGGKCGSGGYRIASNLDVFVPYEEAVEICKQVVLLFRDYGPREVRNRARLAFLLQDWGEERSRRELEQRYGKPLYTAGKDQRVGRYNDHIGVFRQKQEGMNYVGLLVPVGRITTEQLLGVADLADKYGNGEIRLTPGQNLIIPNVPDKKLREFISEPLVQKELKYNPSPIMRGLVSCTGIDYCNLAVIETKGWALQIAQELEQRLGDTVKDPITIHWSGCPAGCGNHQVANIGLLGRRAKVKGQVVDAVDVFIGGSSGPEATVGQQIMEDVPCQQLSEVLAYFVQHYPKKERRRVIPLNLDLEDGGAAVDVTSQTESS